MEIRNLTGADNIRENQFIKTGAERGRTDGTPVDSFKVSGDLENSGGKSLVPGSVSEKSQEIESGKSLELSPDEIRQKGLEIKEYIHQQQKRIDPADLAAARGAGKEGETKPLEPGAQKEFWVWDFKAMPPQPKKISATLQGGGENAYVFVEDSAWGKSVKPEDVQKIENTFNKNTPPASIDPNKGIYQIDTGVFGQPPRRP